MDARDRDTLPAGKSLGLEAKDLVRARLYTGQHIHSQQRARASYPYIKHPEVWRSRTSFRALEEDISSHFCG